MDFFKLHQVIKSVFADAAHKNIAVLEVVVNKVMQQLEIDDSACAAHMSAWSGAVMQLVTDGNMVLVMVSDGQILRNQVTNVLFKIIKVDVRLVSVKNEGEAAAYITVHASAVVSGSEEMLAEVFSGMGHKPVRQRGMNYIIYLAGFRPENAGTDNNDLFSDADKKVGVDGKQGVN